MQVPKEFTLFGNKIKVKIEDIDLDNGCYGIWNDAKEEITLYKKVKVNNEIIELSSNHILSTFFHELRHAMQWYSLGEYNEQDAQSFASMMMEFIKSSGIKINPNIIQEPVFYEE